MLGNVGSKVTQVGETTSKMVGPALNFRALFLAVVAVALSYATVLLIVVHAYRKAYGISYEQDALFPREEQERLAAAIPGSTLKIYPKTGHAVHWERPEKVVRDFRS